MEEEHSWADPVHAEVERIGVKNLRESRLSSQEVDRFRAAIRDLGSMYERHISIEDDVVFPLAARLFSEKDRAAMAEEMAGRRQVKLVAIGGSQHGL